MTKEELQAIRERAGAVPCLYEDDTLAYHNICRQKPVGPLGLPTLVTICYGVSQEFADFVIEAHNTDIPALLAEVDRLQAIVNQLPAPAHCDENHTVGMSAVEERG